MEFTKEKDFFEGLLMVTKIGDVLCNTKEERNNWKKRMMKANLGEAIGFPGDWDNLPEDEKEKRLNKALGVLRDQG